MIARRQLLGMGAVGLGAAALQSCASLPFAKAPPMSQAELEAMLRRLDRIVAALGASKPAPERFGMRSKGPQIPEGHAVITGTLAALSLVGTYREIPDTAKSDARIAKRLDEAYPEILDAMTGARDRLRETDADFRARLDAKLRADPSCGMRALERLDELAQEHDVPLEHRVQLRTTMTQLAWRFRAQGTTAVIDDLTAKLDRGLDRAMLGMPVLEDVPSDEPGSSDVTRAQIRTSATVPVIHAATCSLAAKAVVQGRSRAVDLEWDGGGSLERCGPEPQGDAIHGRVSVRLDGADRLVIVELLRPPDATAEGVNELFETARNIAREIRVRAESRMQPALGPVGASCTWNGECLGKCLEGRCVDALERTQTSSSGRLLHSTGKVAKVAAWLLIPPICFIGITILVGCMFVAIVAGFMALGGD
jgi:hypothetical protein